MIPIIDLHCDLLCYLAEKETRTALDRDVRCSLPQLHEGGVTSQVLAVYTETKVGSAAEGQKQLEIFAQLPKLYPNRFSHEPKEGAVCIRPAIENSSGLLEEEEPLDLFFKRFESLKARAILPLYVSLTWNTENRFGGGNESNKGITKDGERVLEYLSGQGVAIDLSHTSDSLAYDIFNTIDKKRLRLLPIASHSNFRSICQQRRNLPDEFALEIIRRGGIIGLNFIRPFIGIEHFDFMQHIEQARSLGALGHLCFGADFFFLDDFSLRLKHLLPMYFPQYSDASCYPALLAYFSKALSSEELKGIAHANVERFLERMNPGLKAWDCNVGAELLPRP